MITVPGDLGPRGYEVSVGRGAVAGLGRVLADRRRVAIVTQAGIPDGVLAEVRTALDAGGVRHATTLMDDGEEAKTLGTVDALARGFARDGLLRGDAVVAVGGGVVGDTAGFTAATYHRGIDVVQVPTTLLAMVDAAIGGKTGVNLPEGKNLVGAFHQPRAVLVDPGFLASLPDREFRCGLGEVAKYALMEDPALVADAAAVRDRDPDALTPVIARCAAIKARFVVADEYERSGTRAVLNYGHTLAHALETATDHALLHGEAVAVGLVFAGHLAGALGRIPPAAVRRHGEIVAALGLPDRAPEGLRGADLVALMGRDKKSGGGLTFVLPGPDGITRVDDPDPAALRAAFAAVGVGG
ncbi:MAG: 3-dehydroquinate synthase [Actinomycetota bacterium]